MKLIARGIFGTADASSFERFISFPWIFGGKCQETVMTVVRYTHVFTVINLEALVGEEFLTEGCLSGYG